jgi:hypothetical protein
MTQRLPPVLSRQVSRPIILPTRATPLKHIPAIPSAEHAGYPHRIDGERERGTQSHHIPSHQDIMSTLQPTQDKGPAGTPVGPPGGVVIHSEGTNNIGGTFGPGPLPLCSATFDRPRAVTVNIAIRPGITDAVAPAGYRAQGTLTLLATIRVGRGRAATRFNVDIPIFGSTSATSYVRSPDITIPLVAESIDVSMRFALFGWGLSNALWVANVLPPAQSDQIFDDPPIMTPAQSADLAVLPVTAWIGEAEAMPRKNYPFRRVTALLDAAGGANPSMQIPLCSAIDRVGLIAGEGATPATQPFVTFAFIGPGAVGVIGPLYPNEEPLVVPNQCHLVQVTNTDGALPHNFCLTQYASL